MLSVNTCPICLKWERERRYGQWDLFPTDRVASALERDDHTGPLEEDPSETLAAIRAVDPSF